MIYTNDYESPYTILAILLNAPFFVEFRRYHH